MCQNGLENPWYPAATELYPMYLGSSALLKALLFNLRDTFIITLLNLLVDIYGNCTGEEILLHPESSCRSTPKVRTRAEALITAGLASIFSLQAFSFGQSLKSYPAVEAICSFAKGRFTKSAVVGRSFRAIYSWPGSPRRLLRMLYWSLMLSESLSGD